MLNKGQEKAREALIAEVERHYGTLDWSREPWFGGSARADLPDGGYVSVMVEPPENTEHIHYDGVYTALIEEPFKEAARWMTVTDVGIQWHTTRPMPQRLYAAVCTRAGVAFQGLRWAAGDLMNHGEESYGETYAAYLDAFGVALETLKQWKRVAKAIPYDERNNDIPWSYWQSLAGLNAKERQEVIEDIQSGAIEDAAELRQEVKRRRGEDIEDMPPCPWCGGKLTPRHCKGCGIDFTGVMWWAIELKRERGWLPPMPKRV